MLFRSWVQVVQQLYQQGVRTFVEVGPGAVLSGLVRRILADCRDITIVQFDQRGRSSAEQLDRLRDTLGLASHATREVSASERREESQSTGAVFRFDATARRRERNRNAASGIKNNQAVKSVTKTEESSSRNGSHTARFDYATARKSSQSDGEAARRSFSNSRRPEPSPEPSIVDVPSALSHPVSPSNPTNAQSKFLELESFLVDFVVEQTGYPREIVELDADLEADLGIDSIRKAQLFGEIGQKYDLQADDDLSLDDFPTLRHLLEYMEPRIGGGSAMEQSASLSEIGRAHV